MTAADGIERIRQYVREHYPQFDPIVEMVVKRPPLEDGSLCPLPPPDLVVFHKQLNWLSNIGVGDISGLNADAIKGICNYDKNERDFQRVIVGIDHAEIPSRFMDEDKKPEKKYVCPECGYEFED